MRQDVVHHAIVLYPDKTRLFKTALPSLLSGLLVLPLIISWRSRKRSLHLVSLPASMLLFFWESLFLSQWYRLLFPKPVVVVNEAGIAYDPVVPWFVAFRLQIRWEEIAAMFLSEVSMRGKKGTRTSPRFLTIMPKDQEVFVKQHKLFRPRRLPLLVVMSQFAIGTPFLMPELAISPFPLDELLVQIRTKYQPEIVANAIEIGEERKLSMGKD
jgi:hypothetical protein